MKQNLKFMILSIITLTVASFQVIHSMEDFLKLGEDAQRPSRVSSSSDTTEEPQQEKRKCEEIRENPFEGCPLEIVFNILELAASADYLSGDIRNCNLKRVCQNWRNVIEQDAMKKAIRIRLAIPLWLKSQDEAIYQRFLNGALVYRPTPNSDAGMITLHIRGLSNPLEGTFDLSRCGDTGNYLSISTGYWKGKKSENASKVKIWFAPRFLIEKEINTMAKHFQAFFHADWNANAPIGMFWTGGGDTEGGDDDLTCIDHLITESMDDLSKINLYENWKKTRSNCPPWLNVRRLQSERGRAFHVSFADYLSGDIRNCNGSVASVEG